MGDIVALVEKAQETVEVDKANRMMRRFQKGQFNMNDFRSQLEQMITMGGMQGIMGMIPGMGKMSKQLKSSGFDDNIVKRQIAMIHSMTKKERINPSLLQASRKKRISNGSGTEVSELNRLIKTHRQMADMMKKMGRTGNKGMLRGMMGQLMGKGALPSQIPGQDHLSSGNANIAENLPKLQLPQNLSGLGNKK